MQIPAPFDYARATDVDNALALLERHGPDARLVAGGHSLLPMMKLRLARPEWLIDINGLAELDFMVRDGNVFRVGALTRQRAKPLQFGPAELPAGCDFRAVAGFPDRVDIEWHRVFARAHNDLPLVLGHSASVPAPRLPREHPREAPWDSSPDAAMLYADKQKL